MAWAGKTGWRVEERPKKTDPAVDNPAVTVPKLKSKGNERVEVGGCDERLGRARISEETVPVLHSHVERLNVGEFRRETEVKTGKCEQKIKRTWDTEKRKESVRCQWGMGRLETEGKVEEGQG